MIAMILTKSGDIQRTSRKIGVHGILCYHAWPTILFTYMRTFLLRRPCGMPCKKKYEILSETRLCALELKVNKLKCANNKGMEKHLLTLSAYFANLKKAGQPYSHGRKRLT